MIRAVTFGREVCGDPQASEQREWLVTNGIGGFACGTISGLLTRCYHSLLTAALKPPLGRTLLVSKLEEEVRYGDRTFPLSTNRWSDGTVSPQGYVNIEQFYLDGTTPVWEWACGDALLEKRIWMQYGTNTTYIRYVLQRNTQPLHLTLKVLVNYRDYHHTTQANGWQMDIVPVDSGLKIQAFTGAVPFYLLTSGGQIAPAHTWYQGFDLAVERYRGLGDRDDHLHAATVQVTLNAGDAFTLVATTEAHAHRDGWSAWSERQTYEQQMLDRWHAASYLPTENAPPWITQLVLAADQFLVARPLENQPDGKTVIAGYPWFGDWGRDTMISLPGLTTYTGRPDIARPILQTFATYVDQGMLPNVFPEAGDVPAYNTIDAALWYFEAVWAYYSATQDRALLVDLFPVLVNIIDWHEKGTRHQIHLDPADGLLYGGEAGVQLTWMDAKVDDWVVTPRIGKPVEVNALWYNALGLMIAIAQQVDQPGDRFRQLAEQTAQGFKKFWNAELGYCYDVIDSPNGADSSLRPNQIFAVSLAAKPDFPLPPLLSDDQQRRVVEACGQRLLTSHGLRSLSPDHPDYQGHYGGNRYQRDGAYHQGTTWGWLSGAYALAHYHAFKEPIQAQQLLVPMAHHLQAHCVGSLSEIFDGEAPITPRGAFAQAWSVAEVLRAWLVIEMTGEHARKTTAWHG